MTEFNLLGLKFTVDLDKMPEMNFSVKLTQIKESINHWSRRKLTPLGQSSCDQNFSHGKVE